jgi:GH18 family chitinase
MVSTVSTHDCHLLESNTDQSTVDWEHPENSRQGEDYVALLAILRQYLPGPRYTLSTALPAGEWALQHINLPIILTWSI